MFGRNEVLRMNILIAGGTGYIGSHICVELLESGRSEEHTSELQSHSRISYAVFCLK